MLCLLDNMRFYKRFLGGHVLRFLFFFQNNHNLSLFPASELVEIIIEVKIHSIQIMANDFNGSNSLRFLKSFVIFYFFLWFISKA